MMITICGMGILIVFIIGYYSFILPKEEILSYKLYELRDQVAFEVLNGNLSENDVAYIYMITLINTQINFIDGKIPYTEMFTSSLKISVDEVDSVLIRIKSNSVLNRVNEEVTEIYKKSFRYKKYIIQYMYVKPFLTFLNLCISILNASKNISNKKKKKRKREIYEYKQNANFGYGVLKRMW